MSDYIRFKSGNVQLPCHMLGFVESGDYYLIKLLEIGDLEDDGYRNASPEEVVFPCDCRQYQNLNRCDHL
jgi:hypothetical protein